MRAMRNPSLPESSLIETALKRDRVLVIVGLGAVILLSWAYLFYLAQGMGGMAGSAMPDTNGPAMAGSGSGSVGSVAAPLVVAWGPVDFTLTFLMWGVMMVAMMAPSAAPMILTFATVNRRRWNHHPLSPATAPRTPIVPTGVFLAGYLLAWWAFSLAATLAQWGLHSASLLSPMLASASPVLGGILLLTAGAFQWSPLKYACLNHCRTPMSFLTADWREGYQGALSMGLRHGCYCLGCCWALMGLLFVLGVMNLLWIATLAALVLVEKVLPAGHWVGRIAGLGLIAWGLWLILTGGVG